MHFGASLSLTNVNKGHIIINKISEHTVMNDLSISVIYMYYWIYIEAYRSVSNQIKIDLNRDPKNQNWIELWGSWPSPTHLRWILNKVGEKLICISYVLKSISKYQKSVF